MSTGASRETRAPCALLNIGSGAAHNVYEGWSAYCAGKAAADHWVRTVGAEQQRRGGHCLVVSIAPGIVATAMQEQIRRTAPAARAMLKEVLNRNLPAPEVGLFRRALGSPELSEGMRAFLEKREPVWPRGR